MKYKYKYKGNINKQIRKYAFRLWSGPYFMTNQLVSKMV